MSKKPLGMNLEEFIAETLVQIRDGINAANSRIAEARTRENPDSKGYKPYEMSPSIGEDRRHPGGVEFDVAVTSSREGEGGLGAKAKLWVLDASIGGRSAAKSETVSRVRFRVDAGQVVK